jgi:twitching motility protein PilJ
VAYSLLKVTSPHSLVRRIIQMNFCSSSLLRGVALVLFVSAYAIPAAAIENASPTASSVDDRVAAMRQALQACRVAATAGTVLGAIPTAWMWDEPAMRQVVDGVAALQYSNATFASPVPPRSSFVRSAELFASQQDVVLKVARATQLLRQQSALVLEAAQDDFAAEMVDNAGPARIAAASAMAMLSQRIGKSAAEFVGINGLSAEAIFLLGKDMTNFQELLDAMLDGKAELRIKPTQNPATQKRLAALSESFGAMKEQALVPMSNLSGLVDAREALARLQMDLSALAKVALQACEP